MANILDQQITNLTEDQIRQNLESFRRRQKNEPESPTDISGTSMPELPDTTPDNTNAINQALDSASIRLDDYVKLLGSGEATSEMLTSAQAGITKKLLGLIEKTSGQSGRKAELIKEEGITEKQKEVQKQTSALRAERQALKNSVDQLYSEGGLTKGQLSAQQRELTRASLSRQADMAILAQAASDDLQTAYDTIEFKLDLEFGDEIEQLDIFKQSLGAISGLEDTVSGQLKAEADAREAELKAEKDIKEDLYRLAVDAQQAGQTSLAQEFMNTAKGIVNEDTLADARERAIANGVFVSRSATGSIGRSDFQSIFTQQTPQNTNFVRRISVSKMNEAYDRYTELRRFGFSKTSALNTALQEYGAQPISTESAFGLGIASAISEELSNILD